ncbi:type II toxin-antitoxin system Phd/YefM family antitoxin [Microbacterium sp. X-17]|uniref:type II toxin-antitoxin system Phd/YefM family antitoxin n=1 Tax=Microbacterium sp. X-17 TaxID=3144404 RepID=UPI0031F5A9D1
MALLDASISARDLRQDLAAVVGRAEFGHERLGITRHGKLAAVMISVEDLELLEQLELERDRRELRAAKRADTGERISLSDLRAEFDG